VGDVAGEDEAVGMTSNVPTLVLTFLGALVALLGLFAAGSIGVVAVGLLAVFAAGLIHRQDSEALAR
jgi:hypothetical protein